MMNERRNQVTITVHTQSYALGLPVREITIEGGPVSRALAMVRKGNRFDIYVRGEHIGSTLSARMIEFFLLSYFKEA
jgi:hypothetical protein